LPDLSVNRSCTILTVVPTLNTPVGTARATAVALGLNLVAPRLTGLLTFDQVHLDTKSAQRWSSAFLEQAGPQIQRCLSEQRESEVAISSTRTADHETNRKLTNGY
jgi:hypothetical protein